MQDKQQYCVPNWGDAGQIINSTVSLTGVMQDKKQYCVPHWGDAGQITVLCPRSHYSLLLS